MQDELTNQIVEQLRLVNQTLKSILKRLDSIESAIAKPEAEEELVILPKVQPSPSSPSKPPETPPIIESLH